MSVVRPQPDGSIDLAEADLKDAREIMRVFLEGEQPIHGGIFIDPPSSLQPFGFGILLSDLLHHAAHAYAYKFQIEDVDRVREAIIAGLMAELENPTDTPKPASN
ncbi:DUF5076 domain-containing protein [Qipengyuania sphaerica]|uniref:DUF5076 domain-containing protein n=1 Tax=Qipengyuania sphaerica TaxID=2867243 RepID=UPI001C87F5A0|nr:DUF5076 domain-containing protein [Qipengyuania sphaerica]